MKNNLGIIKDDDITDADLKQLCELYKKIIYNVLGKRFPDDPDAQLWGAISAVFKSWNGNRAINYRNIENIIYRNIQYRKY